MISEQQMQFYVVFFIHYISNDSTAAKGDNLVLADIDLLFFSTDYASDSLAS